MGIAHKGAGPKTPVCEGNGPEDPGVVAPLHLAQSLGHARVKAHRVIGRIGCLLRYAGWLHAQGVGVCCTMTVVNVGPHHRDLQVGDRADRCCSGVHHCVCRSSKLGLADLMHCSMGLRYFSVSVASLVPSMTVLSDFLRAAVPEDSKISSMLVSKLAFFHCFTAFFRRSKTRGFRAECGAHPAGGKIHAASIKHLCPWT